MRLEGGALVGHNKLNELDIFVSFGSVTETVPTQIKTLERPGHEKECGWPRSTLTA